MMKITVFHSVLVSALIVSACVQPHLMSPMVTKKTVNDRHLSCYDIAHQLSALQTIRNHAETGHQVSVQSIAASEIFEPSPPHNTLNVEQTVEVVNRREMALVKIAAQRSCKLSMQNMGPSVVGKL